MKENFAIAFCGAALIAISSFLVLAGINPVSTVSTHGEDTPYSWYYKPRTDGEQPICADNAIFIHDYPVYYLGNPDKKEIYLTFDIGYENGNTLKILDVLASKNVTAAFFVTGHYIKSAPDATRRMEAEGHLVCNHTFGHKDMTKISYDEFMEEVAGLEALYTELTGKKMAKYIRPPEGKFSEKYFQLCAQIGYTNVFWSFAYRDWLNDAQPTEQDAISKMLTRTHNGEIVLLHSTSATNAAVLGYVIDEWQKNGYIIKSLDSLQTPPS